MAESITETEETGQKKKSKGGKKKQKNYANKLNHPKTTLSTINGNTSTQGALKNLSTIPMSTTIKEIPNGTSSSMQIICDSGPIWASDPWKPTKLDNIYKNLQTTEENKTKKIFRNMRSILNKLTPQKFAPLMHKALALNINTETRLCGVVDLMFRKAIKEPIYSKLYANMCRIMSTFYCEEINMKFRKTLQTQCQHEFEKEKMNKAVLIELQAKLMNATKPKKKKQLVILLEQAKAKKQCQTFGYIRFIGELFRVSILEEASINNFIKSLFNNNDEDSVKGLCILLTNIGKNLDHEKAKIQMDQYFTQVKEIVKDTKISCRVRFMIQDVIGLRANNWVQKALKPQGPKNINQIHRDFDKEKLENTLLPCDECWVKSKQYFTLQKKFEDLETCVELNEENICYMSQKIETLKSKNNHLKSSLYLKNQELEDSQKDNFTLNTKIENLKSGLDLKEKKIEDLKEENTSLKKEKNDLIKEKTVTYYQTKDVFCVTGDNGLLGRGSYGSVRLAFINAWGAVAVKCFQETGSQDEVAGFNDKIRNECQMLQLSTHINVVRVIGYTTWPRSAGIIMEYMLGGNLRSLLLLQKEKVKIIPPVVRLRFVSDISKGMAYMHNMASSQRVTHGDLKVDNILLTGDLTCKISDFGGADFSTCSEESSTNEIHHANTHTKVFSAPEALKKPHGKVRKSMDVYSFSMMVYMILTRKPPNKEMTIENYLDGIKKGDRPNTDEIQLLKATLGDDDIKIVDQLQEEMKNCWKHDQEQRPTIINVRNRLRNTLSKVEVWIIQDHICKIARKLGFKNPCEDSYDCQPIDKFSPPNFQFTE